jgi:hypothetical protein
MENAWRDILSVAIHTPSPHNVQPWRIKIVSEVEAELFVDSTRTLPKEDTTGSFIICAMGMFIEAMSILAGQRGLRISHTLLARPDEIASQILEAKIQTLIQFAKLTIDQLDAPPADIYDEQLFLKRRTSRLNLDKRSPAEDSIAALRRVAEEWNQDFRVTVDPGQIERILELNSAALFEDLNSTEYHDEIIQWFRYTASQSARLRDGLDARCMNTSPLNYWIIANVPQILRLPVTGQILSTVYRRQIGHVPALGSISGAFWKPADSLDVGRFLMRFWLETARQGLYIHPYGNLVTNRRAADAVEHELSQKDIWFIFKIGYSNEPPKSHRLALEKVLVP